MQKFNATDRRHAWAIRAADAGGLLGVFLILVTLPVLMKKHVDPLDRLKAPHAAERPKSARNCGRRKAATSWTNMPTSWNRKNKTNIQRIKLKLVQAGYHSKNAVRNYYFAQFVLGILGLILGGIYALMNMQQGESKPKT